MKKISNMFSNLIIPEPTPSDNYRESNRRRIFVLSTIILCTPNVRNALVYSTFNYVYEVLISGFQTFPKIFSGEPIILTFRGLIKIKECCRKREKTVWFPYDVAGDILNQTILLNDKASLKTNNNDR